MTISDFVSKCCFDQIKGCIDKKEVFEHRKEHKKNGGSITITLKGCNIEQELADKIWNGHNYLVHFDVQYNGREFGGLGGCGFAMDDFSIFESWDKFKDWFNNRMKRYNGYEVEKEEQMSLF